MSNEDPTGGTGGTRRSPRQGVGGSPLGSTLSIVLAVVAVVAGFLILRNITDDGGGASVDTDPGAADTTTTLAGPTTTTEPAVTTTTLTLEGATVVVANASGVSGSAGAMTAELEAVGFTMAEATNSSERNDETLIYYDPSAAAAQAVADSVSIVMGGPDVATVPEPPPVEGGDLGDAAVLVLLGVNQANRTLAELQGTETTETTTATGTSPEPSGSTTATTAATETTASG
ncbi:MAG: LytR C-terminal domain-containing protein [Actinomycetota bacterium]